MASQLIDSFVWPLSPLPVLAAGPAAEYASSTAVLLSVLPLVCAAAMSGCFLFLQRLAGRRGRGGRGGAPRAAAASPRAATLECGLGGGLVPLHAAAHGCALGAPRPTSSACLHLGASSSSSLDGAASPLSDSGTFSSCDSASFYPSPCSSGSLLGLGSGGAPSPTGHVRHGDAARHEAALQVGHQEGTARRPLRNLDVAPRLAETVSCPASRTTLPSGQATLHRFLAQPLAQPGSSSAPPPHTPHTQPHPTYTPPPSNPHPPLAFPAGCLRDPAGGAPAGHQGVLPLCAQAAAPHPHPARG